MRRCLICGGTGYDVSGNTAVCKECRQEYFVTRRDFAIKLTYEQIELLRKDRENV
jgi:hypothetical protein